MNHILPLSEGGTNDESNLESLCWSCHKKIHGKRGDI
ncbi:HNH endonuclease [Stecheria intestinalis]|nr:HNH endonuclease [Stecheria intestinalis]MDD5880399.1 HNH endonuclease [Stecheria intestinalis]